MTVVYTPTSAGNDAVSARNGQTDGHIDVLRGRLRRFPDQLIDDWLKELCELELIEARPAGTLPVVMLTAKTELADIHRGLALGADGYIRAGC